MASASKIRMNYHEDAEALVNKQINMEFYASYVYLSMVCNIVIFSHFYAHKLMGFRCCNELCIVKARQWCGLERALVYRLSYVVLITWLHSWGGGEGVILRSTKAVVF